MRRMKILLLSSLLAASLLTGCGDKKADEVEKNVKEEIKETEKDNKEEEKAIAETDEAEENFANLEGHKIFAYCGAGMTKPFTEICNRFQELTKCEVTPNFANGAQIRSQITTSEEGDFFCAGSRKDLTDISDFVTEDVDLVKHIPVLAVTKGNPKDIKGLDDLTKDDVTFIMGSVEQTPIGKIAKKALTEKGIFDKVHIAANTPTAPAMMGAVASGEADACIVWKENCENNDKVEIVETDDLNDFIKTIPIGYLKTASDKEACDEFMKFQTSDIAKQIWKDFGYELVEK